MSITHARRRRRRGTALDAANRIRRRLKRATSAVGAATRVFKAFGLSVEAATTSLIVFGRAIQEAERLSDLEAAEQSVRTACSPPDSAAILASAPAYDGTTYRRDVLRSAAYVLAAGTPAAAVCGLLRRGYGPMGLEMTLSVLRMPMVLLV